MKTTKILIAVFSILFTLGFNQGVYAQNQPVEVMSPVVSFLNNGGDVLVAITPLPPLEPQKRVELIREIIQEIEKGKTDKMIKWKIDEGKEFPNFKFIETTIKIGGKVVVIQFFPPTTSSSKDSAQTQEVTPGSLTFFWNEVDPQTKQTGRWSLSMSLQGNIETGVCPKKSQTTILTASESVGEKFKGFWQSTADQLVRDLHAKLKPSKKP